MAFYPEIPEIAKAYENDPRTKLAMTALAQGASTAPVAAGKYGFADGIARALQGVAGAYMQKRQDKAYAQQQQDMMSAVAAALGGAPAAGDFTGALGGTGTPAAGAGVGEGGSPPPAAQAAGSRVAPTAAPPQPSTPQTVPQAPQTAPQGFDALGRGAPAAPQPGRSYNTADAVAELGMTPEQAQQFAATGTDPRGSSVHPQIAAALGGGGAGNTAIPFAGPNGLSAINLMIPITALTESAAQDFTKAGKPVTSNKGAKYKMQVMPATARNPGFGITPAQADTPEEYNRVGTELLGKLMDKYGDPAKAWAAYNGGTGRVDHAVAKHGDAWLAHMPTETQKYVAKNVAALGDNAPQATATAEMQPTGPTQYETPEPAIPDLPTRPQDRTAAQSLRLDAGRKLLNAKNPALFERAMALLDSGMGEQFNADREALAEANKRDDASYSSALDDAYNARSQSRQAAYNSRSNEQQENYAYGREMRGYQHSDANREDEQQFQASEADKSRAASKELTQMTIDGKHEDVQARAAARFQNFLNTPQGARMYQQSTDTINQNDNIANQIDAFMDLNEKAPNSTGGMLMNMPTGAGEFFARNLNTNTQQMDQITHSIAPLLRKAGQGSMSDRDLEMFERSIPNIRATLQSNRGAAQRVKAGIARMNDFELNKVKAASEGRQVEFLQEWNAYKSQVPFLSGKSFDEWKASIPSFDATGKRK